MKNYRQISDRDRVTISRLKACGFSISEIARRTGFHKSSLSREFKRNSDDGWTAEFATKARQFRVWKANQSRRRKETPTIKWALLKLKEGWSPEQIAGRSKIDGPEPISHECIYDFIRKDRKQGGRLFTLLRRFRKRKRRLGYRSYGSHLPNRTFIDKRPKIVEKRMRLGDLEADLICGRKNQGYLLNVIDRVSRRSILTRLKTKNKVDVYYGLCKSIEQFKIARTLTVDNGKEFALHLEIAKSKKIKVYFTHPYTSQEKGSVENSNGLIRYYFNSKTNFRRTSDKRIKHVENLLNTRPRKTLNYLTPAELHFKKIKQELRENQRCT